ncbi:hypothetical protein GS931_11365 [Rhodococcus hoagii]|nr:hypothetical protein [Prescottella equi]
MRSRIRPLDILVNNAWRSSGYARLENITDEQLRGGFDMAVMAAFWAMQRSTARTGEARHRPGDQPVARSTV